MIFLYGSIVLLFLLHCVCVILASPFCLSLPPSLAVFVLPPLLSPAMLIAFPVCIKFLLAIIPVLFDYFRARRNFSHFSYNHSTVHLQSPHILPFNYFWCLFSYNCSSSLYLFLFYKECKTSSKGRKKLGNGRVGMRKTGRWGKQVGAVRVALRVWDKKLWQQASRRERKSERKDEGRVA